MSFSGPVSGEEELTLNQAIEFFAYGDLERARKAPVHVSERDFRLESLTAYWPHEVHTGAWDLWHALEDGHVTAIEHGRPVPRSRWSVDRLRQLVHPDEQIGLGPFIREIQRSVGHIRFRAGELMRFSAKPSGGPSSLQADKEPLPAIDEEPSASRRRGRPPDPKWGIITPKVQALVDKDGPYNSIAGLVEEIDKQFRAARRKPFDPTWTARWAKKITRNGSFRN